MLEELLYSLLVSFYHISLDTPVAPIVLLVDSFRYIRMTADLIVQPRFALIE
jgi:hypothetical protein